MDDMEYKISASFKKVKRDMASLYERTDLLAQENSELKRRIAFLERNQKALIENINYLREQHGMNSAVTV